jgi:hypothetical protein
MMGRSLLEDGTDAVTGEVTPVKIVTDNGPFYKSSRFLVFIASHPELAHARTTASLSEDQPGRRAIQPVTRLIDERTRLRPTDRLARQ